MTTAPFNDPVPFALLPQKPETRWQKLLRLVFSGRVAADSRISQNNIPSGALNSGNQGVGSCEGQNQSNYSGLNTSSIAGFSGFNAVDGQGNNSGLLVNVYSDNLLGVNLFSGLPAHDGTLLHNFSHSRTPSLKARFGRACRAFVNAWRAK